MKENKKTIGVIFGGKSSEHDVSIKSASTVIKGLKGKKNSTLYNLLCIYIDKSGTWWNSKVANSVLEQGFTLQNIESPNLTTEERFKSIIKEVKNVDIWYPVLHGPNGEDGTIQGLLTLTGKPFVGSGVLGSALGMDKLVMKALFSAANLPQVSYVYANAEDLKESETISVLLKQIETKLGYPCFVKPANLGSSVGISKAYNEDELTNGLKLAAEFDQRIIIEESVRGRELECAVIGKKELRASTVGEIKHSSDWYDYETKYSEGLSKTLIPAPLEPKITKKIQELSLIACKAINVYGMARVDFFFKEETDEILINEINTLPGFTSHSIYPLLWEASGLNLEQLVVKLVDTATE